jgi:hypothetical protein
VEALTVEQSCIGEGPADVDAEQHAPTIWSELSGFYAWALPIASG